MASKDEYCFRRALPALGSVFKSSYKPCLLLALFRARRLVTAHIKCGRSTPLPARCFGHDALAQHCVFAILAHIPCTHLSGTECTSRLPGFLMQYFLRQFVMICACLNQSSIPAPPPHRFHARHITPLLCTVPRMWVGRNDGLMCYRLGSNVARVPNQIFWYPPKTHSLCPAVRTSVPSAYG